MTVQPDFRWFFCPACIAQTGGLYPPDQPIADAIAPSDERFGLFAQFGSL